MKFQFVHRSGIFIAPAVVVIAFCLSSAFGFQQRGARDPGSSAPAPKPTPRITKGTNSSSTSRSGGNRPVSPRPAPVTQMTIIIPPGCRIWLNEVPVETSLTQETPLLIDGQKMKSSERSAGVITLKGIRPGTYRLIARKPDFREYTTPVTVMLDTENVVTVRLTPNPGKLTVSPSVEGAEIDIVNLETNNVVGRYPERLDQFELAPGQYRVATSRAGYRVAVREIRVNPGESVYLEPLLEPLPRPTPTPKPPSLVTPMSFTVQRQDKYLLFYLHGSSGDPAKTAGTVTVSLNGPANNTVIGNLNGQPCQIELIKLENIAEASIVESPSPANDWTSMVVRIRLKDEKRRPISFAVNWRSEPNTQGTRLNTGANSFIPAQAIRKVQPEYPLMARGSNVGGTVLVLVTIDRDGSVNSTRVIEGPDVFRRVAEEAARKWKFRPATRDGQAVESEQTIQFRFSP
jgi:TonB family protein